MEYRIIYHTIDDDINQEINSMSDKNWLIKRVFEPRKFKESNDEYILIIWERSKFNIY